MVWLVWVPNFGNTGLEKVIGSRSIIRIVRNSFSCTSEFRLLTSACGKMSMNKIRGYFLDFSEVCGTMPFAMVMGSRSRVGTAENGSNLMF